MALIPGLKWPLIQNRLKIDLKSIFNHEGGTQKLKATAQNEAI